MSIRTYSIFANRKEVGTFLSTLNGAKIMARRLQAELPHVSVALRNSQGPVNVVVTGNQRHRVLLANAKKALAPSTRVTATDADTGQLVAVSVNSRGLLVAN
jgi:nitrate reductase NapAB chaperone NapD